MLASVTIVIRKSMKLSDLSFWASDVSRGPLPHGGLLAIPTGRTERANSQKL